MWWQLHINTPGTLVAFNGEYMILNLFRVEKESAKYQPLWSGLNILRLSTTKTYGCIPYTQCIIVLFVDNRGTHYFGGNHSIDVIMSGMASQITGVSSVCSNVCSAVDQRKHQCSASLAFVTRIHRWSVRREMFPFDDVIMTWCILVVFIDVYMTPILHIARQLPISYMWHYAGPEFSHHDTQHLTYRQAPWWLKCSTCFVPSFYQWSPDLAEYFGAASVNWLILYVLNFPGEMQTYLYNISLSSKLTCHR